MQIHIHVFAAMHTELSTRCYYDTVGDVCDVDCSCDLAGNDERGGYGAEVKSGKGCVGFCWSAKIDDTVGKMGNRW